MSHSHPPHILLVNDDPEESAGYQEELSEAGYTVSCAESGQHALQMLAESSDQPDLVVTNIYMPEMDGVTLRATLRERYPRLSVIAMSASAEEPGFVELIDTLFDGAVPKPLRGKSIEQWLGG